MNRLRLFSIGLIVFCIVIAFQTVSIFLSFSRLLDIHHILIHPIWVYPMWLLWTIWSIKSVVATFCISRAYLQEPSRHRTRILQLWTLYFVLDAIWPLAFLWFDSALAAAVLVTCMIPALYLNILETALIDRKAMYPLIFLSLLILSKVFLHWTIYWLKINAL